MCMTVYLASDRPLPLIAWDESAPAFWVGELPEWSQAVHRQFTKPYVYYIGSYHGCGCGFRYARWPGVDEDPGEIAAGRESMHHLAEYLKAATRDGPVELYICWAGDEEAEPEHHAMVSLTQVGDESFAFEERQLLTVVSEESTVNQGANPA
jgi:hypothetical protein